jgi:vesicle-associated membrane protein 4
LNILKEEKIVYEERNRIDDNDKEGYFFFTTTLSGIFYIVFAEFNYPERLIHEFFEEMQREGLSLSLDEKGELNKIAKEKLRLLFEKFKNPKNVSSVAAAKAEFRNVHLEMKNNINNIISNLEDIKALDEKSKSIQVGSKAYTKDAKALERETWWRNFKWTIILILVVITLLLIIILPLVLKKSDNKSTNQIPSSSEPTSTKLN